MKLNKLINVSIIAVAAVIAGCSSVKKTEVAAGANPSEELAALEQQVEQGYAAHYDVLANDEFAKGQSYIKEAKDDMKSNQKQSEILSDVGYAKTYLNRAAEKAATRKDKIAGVIDARQKAIDAGARVFPATNKELAKLDGEIRSKAERLEKMKADDVAELQGNYLKLELSAIKNTQLGKAGSLIQGATDKKASDYSKMALKRAQMDYKNAENLIAANRNGTDSYSAAVAQSNNSADLLVAILAATKQGSVDENTATKVVMQERQIQNLQGQVSNADVQAKQMGSEMAKQGEQLKKAGAAVSLQKAIENARQEFTKDEADVFQQGDKLLIRLKSMNFASGRSDLPSESLPVLAKVKGVAEGLQARKVVVEGHTDSTGSAKVNSTLSESRASAIAKYLETSGIEEGKLQSVGYGFKKPIASNKSKEGRSQNRRVDIIITPDKALSTESSEKM